MVGINQQSTQKCPIAHHIGDTCVAVVYRQVSSFFISAQHTLIFVAQLAKVMKRSGDKKAAFKEII